MPSSAQPPSNPSAPAAGRPAPFSPEPEYQGTRMLNLAHDRLGCWAKVGYEDEPWCVPAAARGTKRTFQIMQQLFRLFASPSNQPVTETVRTIPGG
jgi:hypothetical protein